MGASLAHDLHTGLGAEGAFHSLGELHLWVSSALRKKNTQLLNLACLVLAPACSLAWHQPWHLSFLLHPAQPCPGAWCLLFV